MADERAILATGKQVVVIGGGDTGSDCVGTSIRQGAASVTQLEILPRPPEKENKALTWPNWPLKLRTSTSQEEGCERDWAVSTRRIIGNGRVEALELVRVEWRGRKGRLAAGEMPTARSPSRPTWCSWPWASSTRCTTRCSSDLGVELDARGNVKADTEAEPGAYQTNVPRCYCGDMRRGQSLVVWAIREGRQCARSVDQFLMGYSELPTVTACSCTKRLPKS